MNSPPPYQERLIPRSELKALTAFERVAAIDPRALLTIFVVASIFFDYFHLSPNIFKFNYNPEGFLVAIIVYGILLYTTFTNKWWALQMSRNLATSLFIFYTFIFILIVSVIVHSTAQRIYNGQFELMELCHNIGSVVFKFKDITFNLSLIVCIGQMFWALILGVLVTNVMLVVESERVRRAATATIV